MLDAIQKACCEQRKDGTMDSILTKIYVEVDDFMKDFEKNMKKYLIIDGIIKRDRATKLSLSEIMTIVVFFHSKFRGHLISQSYILQSKS